MARRETSIPILVPGADRRTKAQVRKLVESVLGARARAIERSHRSDSAEPVLLLDRKTTAAEVEALWQLRSPRHIAAAAGGWLTTDSGSDQWVDPAQRPQDSRMSVDFALPGPLVAPLDLLPAWTEEPERTHAREWLLLAAEWRRRWVVCLGSRLRESSIAFDCRRELDVLAELPRPRSDWWLANRFILPDAERRRASLGLETESGQAAVVGAQRSGTSWAAELLGSVAGNQTMHERRTFDLLIEGFPRVATPDGLPVWQTTFLTCCRHLLTNLSTRSHVLALVRHPIAVVRSMLFNWPDLANVASLVARVSGRHAPERELDQAVLIVSTAWANLEGLVRASSDRGTVIEYEALCSEPDGVVCQISRRLGWKGGVDLRAETAPERSFPQLEAAARRTVERELHDLYLALVARAL
jgi:hypothetical protein